MGEKRDAKLFLWAGLFTSIAILGLIKLVFRLHTFFFIGEFILLIFFMSIALLSLAAIYNGLNFGFKFLSLMFGLVLLNLLFMYSKTKPMDLAHLATIVSSSIGFVMAVVNLGEEKKEDVVEEFEEPKEVEEKIEEPEKVEEAEEEPKVEEPEEVEEEPEVEEPEKVEEAEEEPEEENVFVSGPVVASAAGKLYHSPKCDWVELIKEENRVEYNTKAEAEEDGLNPHTCMEEE
ncbi:hypothetical protein KY361_02355 [Candidatus Woesearchaeota archaeon]|nr:hypothetical protein [Candidatus Woesearchaeota archaeon]